MTVEKPNMLPPALVAGGVAGVLTAFPITGCLCCLWVMGAAAAASFYLSKSTTSTLRMGDGAIIGVLTGIIAALTDFIVSIPLAPFVNKFLRNFYDRLAEYAQEMPEGFESIMDGGNLSTFSPWSIVALFFSVLIFAGFGALGGIIGISLFGKRSAPRPPQQGVIDVSPIRSETEDPDHS